MMPPPAPKQTLFTYEAIDPERVVVYPMNVRMADGQDESLAAEAQLDGEKPYEQGIRLDGEGLGDQETQLDEKEPN